MAELRVPRQEMMRAGWDRTIIEFIARLANHVQLETDLGDLTGSALTGLSGDVTATGPGVGAAALSTTGVTAGTYGDATHVGQFTVNAKGRITSASNVPVGGVTSVGVSSSGGTLSVSGSPITSAGTINLEVLKLATARSITITGDAAWAVSFDGSANVSAALTLANSGVTPGTYANATVTVDAKGRVTAASAGTGGGVTTTGSPVSGNLTKFSGSGTITNGDLSGDVTTSGGLATTIANDAVTYAKMQNVSAATRLLGRGSASGAGDIEEITLGTGLTMTGTTLSVSGSYTDEQAQDAVGGIISGTGLTSVTYNDTTPSIVVDVPAAVAADYLAGSSATKAVTPDAAWDSAVPVALTDGATVTPDFGAGINFTWTIGGNRTLANPSNVKPGQTGCIEITQDGTGSRTISSYGSNYRFAGGTDIVLSTASGSIDLLFYYVTAGSKVFLSAQKAIAA